MTLVPDPEGRNTPPLEKSGSGQRPDLACFRPEPTIDCIDCGGTAHLLTTWDEENPPRPGDLAVYRCRDCNDRWDLVLPEPGNTPPL